jgi:hypothetical protein
MKEKTCLDLSDYLAKYIAKFCIGAFLVLLPCIWIGWSSVQVQHVAVLIGGFAGVLSFGVSLPEHDETDEFVDGPETVMQVIKGDPDLTIFRACVEDMKSRLGEYGAEAVGAILMLEGEDHEGITVFAPLIQLCRARVSTHLPGACGKAAAGARPLGCRCCSHI